MSVGNVQPEIRDAESHHEVQRCCFHCCLPGEYLATLLMIHSGFGATAWAVTAWQAPARLIFAVAGVWIVCRAAGAFSGRWFAPLVTVALAGLTWWQANTALPHEALAMFSPLVFFTMLAIIFAADLIELAPFVFASRLRRLNWRRLAFWAFGLTLVIYIVVIPTVGWIIGRMYPPKGVVVIEEMSLTAQVRLHTMQAMTTFFFFVLGATIGSFLNVVAYRLPRGESVVFRPSRCPLCGTRIAGRDNIPIFGWLMLGGRCRACHAPISVRYPIVESIAAALFLLLYFVELISGGANIPVRTPNLFSGIVWIIFYTKWDLLGLYLYHCFAMSVLLACVLFDIDRQRVGVRAKCVVAAALFIPPLIWPELLPVPCCADTAEWLQTPWLKASVSVLAGGILGAILGWLTTWAIAYPATTSDSATRGWMASCLAVVGMSLGWQASIAIILFTLLLLLAAASIAQWRHRSPPRLTVVLLIATVVHHAFWRCIIDVGSTWWPSHRTSASGWVVVAVGYGVLAGANRLLVSRQRHDAVATH
jgi:leader peptidase (prepilin peptidase)/N-methyltransferase